MKSKTLLLEILVITLVFGMAVVGCDDGSNNGDPNDGGQELPAASGNNAVSGKTYYYEPFIGSKITFSATAERDAKGTYARAIPKSGTYRAGEKFSYQDIETGSYTWNEKTKTITLKFEKAAFGSYGASTDTDGIIVRNDIGPLRDRTDYRSDIQAMINETIKEIGQDTVNQYLSEMGFSSVSAYLDYMVKEKFENKTNAYSFSADGTALFLEELRSNKGVNELSGQTYYGMRWDNDQQKAVRDTRKVYIFTASGYTFTDRWGTPQTITGAYAYDSSLKLVWLRPTTINGKNRAAYYAEQTADSRWNHLVDDNAYRAAQTNEAFYLNGEYRYNSTNKTIETNWGGGDSSETPSPPDWEED